MKSISDLENTKPEKSPKSCLLRASEDKSSKYKIIFLTTIHLKTQKARSDFSSPRRVYYKRLYSAEIALIEPSPHIGVR
jgi:hypothetical protein